MSNTSTNAYRLTAKFWLWLANQAELEGDTVAKENCLEQAMTAALWEEQQ